MELDEIRKRIDNVDEEMQKLFDLSGWTEGLLSGDRRQEIVT